MIDFYLSAARNAKAAKRFLGKALRGSKEWEQSHRRQYDLVEVARRHGFARVEVIDDDLGLSATRTASETSLHPQSSNPPHITSGLQNKPPAPSALPCSSPCRPCSTPSCDRSRLAPHPAIPRESIEPRPAVVPRSAHEILPDPRLSPQDRTSRPYPFRGLTAAWTRLPRGKNPNASVPSRTPPLRIHLTANPTPSSVPGTFSTIPDDQMLRIVNPDAEFPRFRRYCTLPMRNHRYAVQRHHHRSHRPTLHVQPLRPDFSRRRRHSRPHLPKHVRVRIREVPNSNQLPIARVLKAQRIPRHVLRPAAAPLRDVQAVIGPAVCGEGA